MKIHAERLLTPDGWRENQVAEIENGLIREIVPGTDGDIHCACLTPGLFDIHQHGGALYGANSADMDGLRDYLVAQAQCGVTDVLMGVSSHIEGDDYRTLMDFYQSAMELQARGGLPGARIRGVHLEGPFLNPEKNGGMLKEAMLRPSAATYEHLFGGYDQMVKLVTLAPEMEGAQELTAHLLKKGIRVQAGHTDAKHDEAERYFAWGIDSMCHTFNAARSIHHREPGILTAALLNKEVYCEAICDFHHLHPAAVQLIYRMKGPEKMVVISDSANVTGMADGEYELNGKKYLVIDGTPRAHGGGTLCGGACFLDGCVRNLISAGIPAEDAVNMASRTPAARLGLTNIGRIQAGCEAQMTAWDAEFESEFSIIGGRICGKR